MANNASLKKNLQPGLNLVSRIPEMRLSIYLEFVFLSLAQMVFNILSHRPIFFNRIFYLLVRHVGMPAM